MLPSVLSFGYHQHRTVRRIEFDPFPFGLLTIDEDCRWKQYSWQL